MKITPASNTSSHQRVDSVDHAHKNKIARVLIGALTLTFSGLIFGCSKQHQKTDPETAETNRVNKPVFILRDVEPIRLYHHAQDITPQTLESADYKLLFIGNSHIRQSPDLLAKLFKILQPQKKILIARSMGGFLSQHAQSQNTIDMIKAGKWDFIFLQAQKYSTSGNYSYPIDDAVSLAKLGQKQGAKIIMFPEWSRRGIPDEYLRINKIHQQIADQTGAQVAPIGQTWNAIAEQRTDLVLHDVDGNHASNIGHFINSCLFYSIITGQSPILKPEDPAKWKLEKEITLLVEAQLKKQSE